MKFFEFLRRKPSDYKVALADIQTIRNFEIPESRVNYYLQLYREGKVIPPIFIHKLQNGKFEILDGHARFLAYQQLGLSEIPARVKPSSIRTIMCEPSPPLKNVEEISFWCPILNASVFLSNCQLTSCKSLKKNRCQEQPPKKEW